MLSWAVVAQAFNPSTWKVEAGGFLSSRPACLQSEFQDSQGYTEKPCLKTNEQMNEGGNERKENRKIQPLVAMVVHTFNPRTFKAEA